MEKLAQQSAITAQDPGFRQRTALSASLLKTQKRKNVASVRARQEARVPGQIHAHRIFEDVVALSLKAILACEQKKKAQLRCKLACWRCLDTSPWPAKSSRKSSSCAVTIMRSQQCSLPQSCWPAGNCRKPTSTYSKMRDFGALQTMSSRTTMLELKQPTYSPSLISYSAHV